MDAIRKTRNSTLNLLRLKNKFQMVLFDIIVSGTCSCERFFPQLRSHIRLTFLFFSSFQLNFIISSEPLLLLYVRDGLQFARLSHIHFGHPLSHLIKRAVCEHFVFFRFVSFRFDLAVIIEFLRTAAYRTVYFSVACARTLEHNFDKRLHAVQASPSPPKPMDEY